MRWEILDTFEVLKVHRSSRAHKRFTGNEDFFADHFPGRPSVPEPLLIEMIAQAGGVLFGLGLDFKREVILAKIASARFGTPIVPPCDLAVEAEIREEREEGAWITGVVTQNKKEVASADIMLITVEQGQLASAKSIVFNEHFMKHYDIRRVAALSETRS